MVSATESQTNVLEYSGPWDDWDDYVRRASGSTFCHVSAWREILTDVMGAQCIYLVAKNDEGHWRGVLPLVRVRSSLFGHYLISMPFLNAGGPLGDSDTCGHLAAAAVEQARSSGADLVELRVRHDLPSRLRVAHRKITVTLRLPETKEQLWQQVFPPKLRSQIRRPMKEGMHLRFGGDQVAPFYEVFALNMRDLGTPVLPRTFFDRIADAFGDEVVFGVVYWRNQPLAAGCGFIWNDQFELTWASSLRAHKRKAPNMLLYSAFLERMIDTGVRTFDFGRCTPGGGTHRFKAQWGGEDIGLPWRQWSPTDITAPPTADRRLYRTAAAVWRHLPLRLANRFGPVLARKLP